MSEDVEEDETLHEEAAHENPAIEFDGDEDALDTRNVAYRCSCGHDVLIPAGGRGTCDVCHRKISLTVLDPTQTVSLCADIDSDNEFHLVDGPDRSGESLGHFRLMSKLGYGGMGAVYRALDESLQRFVAVKVIRSTDENGRSNTKQITRLLDEAVAQARLNHPNVVTIYYVGRHGEDPFFAMELLPGPTLGKVIETEPLPYGDVIHFARQVCSALSQASRLGLVHGDIKPGNLILSGDRTVKLGDFGLAKTEHSGPTKGISGTLSYIAPELAEGEQPSAHSDMYALGVTLFELTFGRRPYPIFGSTLREQIHSQRSAAMEFPEKWPKAVPRRWREVLEKMLARDPKDRYEDFEELDQELALHAPVGVTSAGLLNRSLSFVMDYSLLALFMLPFWIPGALNALIAQGVNVADFWMDLASREMWGILAPIVPGIATWFEWRGNRTLGRYLFQLRLVDAHGLLLDRKKRVIRSFVRNAPIWLWSFSIAATAVGFEYLVLALSILDDATLVLNILPVLGPKRLALHDRIVGSHVVLDTRSQMNNQLSANSR